MTIRLYILIILLLPTYIPVSAQATNRQKVISLLLEENKLKPPHTAMYPPDVIAPTTSILSTSVCPVPKYALPKGNVICRLEDYVQMHTPMKLNIGVGGQ